MQIIEDRRALHEIPELDRQLPKTLDYLKLKLAFLSCQVFTPAEGALCAWFDFGADSAIAFRADTDALPITEKTGKPYASRHPGRMHACGHDGHMAILLELARRLDKKTGMKRNVLLVFQPAEETSGGARDICRSGVFKKYKVEAIFGLHLWPGLEEGVIASRKNEMLSRSCEVTVEISGRAAHVAKAQEGIDALAAAVEFYRRATALEAALPDNIFRLLKFGRMEGGTVRNAIAGKAVLAGTLRAFQDTVYHDLRAGLVTLGNELEEQTGCKVEVRMSDGYPAVINPPQLYDRVRAAVDFRELETPSMITEDFSWYQRSLPGMFFFLGTGDTPALHADDFDFNEDILEKGVAFFQELATKL